MIFSKNIYIPETNDNIFLKFLAWFILTTKNRTEKGPFLNNLIHILQVHASGTIVDAGDREVLGKVYVLQKLMFLRKRSIKQCGKL